MTGSTSTTRLYNSYRWYAPGTGRYNRADPLGAIRPSRQGLPSPNHLLLYANAAPTHFIDPLGLRVVVDGPEELEDAYETLKNCYPLFRTTADFFEHDTGLFGLPRKWIVTPTDPERPSLGCAQGSGRAADKRTVFVPSGPGCEETMRCIFHEFFERWLIDVGGYPKSFQGRGPADERARHFENLIPDSCCSCEVTD